MNLKLIMPVVLLVGVAALNKGYVGFNEDQFGVERGSNQITFGEAMNSENGVIDLIKPKMVHVDNPEDLRKASLYGWKSYKPGVAGEGDAVHILDDIIDGHPGRQRKPQRPADYRMQRHAKTCEFRRPQAGERIVNAHIGQTLNPSDLHVYSEAEMAEDTRAWLAAHFTRPNSITEKTIVRDHDVPIADIVITDTSAPIYLILQNREGSVLWNIHTAPGVHIAHIVTVGPKTVALNPPPGDYGVDMLLAGPGCAPIPAREPQDWWLILHKMEQLRWDDEKAELQAEIDGLYSAHRDYDLWFHDAFGQPSETGVIGFDLTDYLLAGPAPETPQARLSYRPIEGSTVLVSEQDYIFTAPERARVAFMMGLQHDFIATAAGGDVAALYPEPMQRTAP